MGGVSRAIEIGQEGPLGPFGRGDFLSRVLNPAASVVAQPQAIQNAEAASRDSRGYADIPRMKDAAVQTLPEFGGFPMGRKRRSRRHIGII